MRGVRQREPSTWAGIALGLATVAVAVVALAPFEPGMGRATPALILVLPVVLAGIVGGRTPALGTAWGAAAAFNLAFIPPRGTLKITSVDDVAAFSVFVAVALVVGTLVAHESERRRSAEQRAEEMRSLYQQYTAVVAERERLAEEANRVAVLSRVDEQRRALLRSVSHDLRTPLAAIRAATSDMRSGPAYDDATRNELLDVVGDEAERLDRLVANLLSLSRIEAGALTPDRQAIALDELVAAVVQRLARLFDDVVVVNGVVEGLPLVDADYSQLDQVVTNLLENAVRHSPAGGQVAIRAATLGPWVEVSVADDGDGLPADMLEDVFEPFRRGPGSESSGIGLAICRAVVEAHGGTIRAANRPDGGAIFCFTLPVRLG